MTEKIREFRIIEKIAEGGMGIVYKAFDENLDRYVALKAIHKTFTANEELVARFKQEAKVQAGLTHPNIVSLFNFFLEGDIYYMAMEFIEGETLGQRIKKVGLLPPHKCIPMFLQMLDAVDYAHRKGVIHRDIKPSNILIDKDDNIKIMDFGIAKIIGDRGLTKTGTKMGTLYYMSPEQVVASKEVDNRTDIFSLGITFFEMVTGQLPYENIESDSDYNLMKQIVSLELPSVRKYYPYVPEKVEQAIRKATMRKPEDRFISCAEFKAFIQNERIAYQGDAKKTEITLPPSGVSPDSPGSRGNLQPQEQRRPNPPKPQRAKIHSSVYPRASGFKRMLARALEYIILFGTYFAILLAAVTVFEIEDDDTVGLLAIGLFIVLWFPYLFVDGLRQGRGLLKGAFGMRIINSKAGEVLSIGGGFGRGFLTALLYAVPVLGFIMLIVDAVMLLAEPDGKRIVDKMLGHQVVEEKDITVEGKNVIARERPVWKVRK